MTFTVTPQAKERAENTVAAAHTFRENAQSIFMACVEAADEEIVLATVSPTLVFAAYIIPLSELRERVVGLTPGSWSLVFSPNTRPDEIEARCQKMARLASRKLEVMHRWSSRHSS